MTIYAMQRVLSKSQDEAVKIFFKGLVYRLADPKIVNSKLDNHYSEFLKNLQ